MGRLFWKVALAIALPQALVLSLLFLNTNAFYRGYRPWWLEPTIDALPLLRDSAIAAHEARGQAGTRAFLDRLSAPQRFSFWLLDDQLHELSGRPLPREVAEAIRQPFAPGVDPMVQRTGALRVLSSDGVGVHGRYRLAAAFDLPSMQQGLPGRVIRVFVLCLIMAFVTALGLAYYFAAPLTTLQRTTDEFASGNLDARAGRSLGRRSDQIADLVRDFDRMAERIRDLVYSHKRLLGDVSHELRSPLARMRVALALARRHELPAQTSSLDRLNSEIAVLDTLIGRVLTLARLESGDRRPPMEDVSLNELIEQVITDADYEAEHTPLRIDYAAAPEVRVHGNAELLHSALQNVVRNAIQYAAGVEPAVITLSLLTRDDAAIVTIRDHGPGVPPDALPQLFQPFYRVDDSRVSSHGSTGLGLAITARAIELHGGAVVASNASPGLSVQITLPQLAREPGSVESHS